MSTVNEIRNKLRNWFYKKSCLDVIEEGMWLMFESMVFMFEVILCIVCFIFMFLIIGMVLAILTLPLQVIVRILFF